MKYQLMFRKLLIGMLLIILGLGIVSCGSDEEPTPVPDTPTPSEDAVQQEVETPEEVTAAMPELEGNHVRGGQLYDAWFEVLAGDEEEHEHDHEGEAEAPDTDHPLWATQSSNTRSGADTWRCKECHGWDYLGADGAYGSGSHMTGFVGVMQMAGGDPNDVLGAMKGNTNPDHDFSAVMEEQDLVDIALFISQALIDDTGLINPDKSSTGEAAAGESLYGDVCIKCHGPGGNAINFSSIDDPEFLGHLAPDNPWEFVHKVRFGQPGWPMPSGITSGWTNDDVANVLAYAQTFSAEPFLSGGGQLYDQWWAVVGADAPEDDQPLWSTQSTNERSGADTWRCKECHGWDYMGADGAYGSGSHATGFSGVLDAASMSSDELLGWLDGSNNPDHDFSGLMGEAALNALVTFLQDEMVDITSFVNADKSSVGDPNSGRSLYAGTCVNCHGVDGKTHNFGTEDEPEYVGTLGSDNPWEFFHKASFGQPGIPMPSGLALGWSREQIADLLAYVQTLPTE